MIFPHSSFRKDSGISVILGMAVKMISHTDIPMLDPIQISSQAAQAHCMYSIVYATMYPILLKIMLQKRTF